MKIWKQKVLIKNSYLLRLTSIKRAERWTLIFPKKGKKGKLPIDLRIAELRQSNHKTEARNL